MARIFKWLLALSILVMPAGEMAWAQGLKVDLQKPIAPISPVMWGVFFEDINFAADGGIYAELVKNRSFEFAKPLMGWKEVKQMDATGSVLIFNRGAERPANPRFARFTVAASAGRYGYSNEGFRGMGLREGESYVFSVEARLNKGPLTLHAELTDDQGNVIGKGEAALGSNGWKKYTFQIKAGATTAKGRLNFLFQGNGEADVDIVSLFPVNTWKQRPGGLRADLVQRLADLKPNFVRFPGGCIVEGHILENRYQWKKTVGPADDRSLIVNRWNFEFPHKPAPDYYQTFGVGFYEYFQLSEDIGAEALPILNCGMACQYNSAEVVPVNQLDPYVQDALDLIEFANGATTTRWGGLRASMGHPAPFGLKYLGVGNEQWDEQYVERYKIFHDVLKNAHPEITLISSSGPSPDGPRFDYLWKEMTSLKADLVDEHYYKPPEWFFSSAARYDNYPRQGPKVFAGEYAAHGKDNTAPESKNTWISALSEAAFMTGLERNADVVRMASYAPLFAHTEAWQWRPDMIWFDNLKTVATPNYYVQQLFATNKGTLAVPVWINDKRAAGQDSLYASAVVDEPNGVLILKLVNTSHQAMVQPVTGVRVAGKTVECSLIELCAGEDLAYNSIASPSVILPKERKITLPATKLQFELQPRSLTVVKIPVKIK